MRALVLRIWDEHGSLERVSKPITRLLRDKVLKPVVSATFALEDGPKAHQFIHDRKNVGKVVLDVRA